MPPAWNGKIWAGDSANQSLTRAQSNEHVACNSPEFDNYLALSVEDFKSFYSTFVLGCKQWRSDVVLMSPQEAVVLLQSIKREHPPHGVQTPTAGE